MQRPRSAAAGVHLVAGAAGWQEAPLSPPRQTPASKLSLRGSADSLQASASAGRGRGPGEWPRGQVASGSERTSARAGPSPVPAAPQRHLAVSTARAPRGAPQPRLGHFLANPEPPARESSREA